MATAAGVRDLLIERGTSNVLTFRWLDANRVPRDITGWTARMMIRDHREAEDPPLQEYSTTLGTITIQPSGSTGVVSVDDDTSLYEWRKGWYDIELYPPDGGAISAVRLLQGQVVLDWDVTR